MRQVEVGIPVVSHVYSCGCHPGPSQANRARRAHLTNPERQPAGQSSPSLVAVTATATPHLCAPARPVHIVVSAGSDSTTVTVDGVSIVDPHDVARQWPVLLLPSVAWRSGPWEAPLTMVFSTALFGTIALVGAASSRAGSGTSTGALAAEAVRNPEAVDRIGNANRQRAPQHRIERCAESYESLFERIARIALDREPGLRDSTGIGARNDRVTSLRSTPDATRNSSRPSEATACRRARPDD